MHHYIIKDGEDVETTPTAEQHELLGSESLASPIKT